MIRQRLRRAAATVLDVALPHRCFACGRAPGPDLSHGACGTCWSGLRPIRLPCCPSCGLPRPEGTDLEGPAGGRCAGCLLRPRSAAGVRAAVLYDEIARRFLLRAKAGLRAELLAPLGDRLGTVLATDAAAAAADFVVAVPSRPLQWLHRGFNPADLLAVRVARALALPYRRWVLRPRHLGKTVKRLDAGRRRERARGAFAALRAVPPRRVLLVDDVMTTGATAEGCVRALLCAGAREVVVGAWARTAPPDAFDRSWRRRL